jgi:hypothetical protein
MKSMDSGLFKSEVVYSPLATSEMPETPKPAPPQRERGLVARVADLFGYVPLLGSLVGALRMLVSVAALGALATLATVMDPSHLPESYDFFKTRAVDELKRGAKELIPCATAKSDWQKTDREIGGRITDQGGAYGRYLYVTPEGSVYYAQEKHKETFRFRASAQFPDLKDGYIGHFTSV